jgi:hypothetical protein
LYAQPTPHRSHGIVQAIEWPHRDDGKA